MKPVQHVTTDPNSLTRRLVLRRRGAATVELSITGAAPQRLRYHGRNWVAATPAVEGAAGNQFYAYTPE